MRRMTCLRFPMNLKALDAQLLVVFDALMTHRHVTRAAASIGLSQSAVSHALARLRERFDDPLLIRTARGMEPTERSLRLIGPARDAIRSLESVFDGAADFDPATARDTFVLRIGDANELFILPALLRRLASEAPSVRLQVGHLSPVETVQGLEDGEIDLAVSAHLVHPKSIRSQPLIPDLMVCVTSRSNPAALGELDLERFLALRHIRVVQHPGDVRFLDAALRDKGVARNVVVTIPHWMVALHAVSDSDLVVVAPERLANVVSATLGAALGLTLVDLPIGSDPFSWQLYWHARHERTPGQCWLRQMLRSVTAGDAADPRPAGSTRPIGVAH